MPPAIPAEPQTGLVIRYGFLWRSEAEAGYIEGLKDRPVVIVLARRDGQGSWIAWVAPITHARPHGETVAVELSASECARLGLDEEPHWIAANDLNRFVWPGFDIRRVPGKRTAVYGRLSPATYKALKRLVVDRLVRRRLSSTSR